MKSKKFKIPRTGFLDCTLIIAFNEEAIESFDISTGYLDNNFIFEEVDYQIKIGTSDSNTIITISTESEDNQLNNFIFEIECNHEDNHELNISYYVPTAPFTNSLSSTFFGLADNKQIIPMIDIENESKLNNYNKDELINFKHFLDLSSIKITLNKEAREEAKILRKQERKNKQEMKTVIPDLLEEPMKIDDIIIRFKEIKKKEQVIPVFLWDSNTKIDKLKIFYNYLKKGGYEEFAIRIVSYGNFIHQKSEIKGLHDFIIFADLDTNFNIDYIKNYIDNIKDDFSNIVYLGAHFLTSQMTIPRSDTNNNKIFDNMPLSVYKKLIKDYPALNYGDYCGFDRKTLSSMPRFGVPTARVILEALIGSEKLLIRRGWDELDISLSLSGKEAIGYSNSMSMLLRDIQNGLLDKEDNFLFMDEKLCDADNALKSYYPDKTTPGEIKTLCMRHNVFSIKHNYIKNQNP
jgi:hypothetical protein